VSPDRDLFRAFGLEDEDRTAWADAGLPGRAFQGWLTDRVARRPTGARARAVYGSATVHDFARRAILGALELTPADHLLDVGCGGGQLLREARATGAAATGLDHSDEMVALARETAPGADVILGSAGAMPFPDRTFTALSCSVAFFFFPDPVAVLRECDRVLAPGGRVAIYTTSPELRGTPAAPEPLAGEGHFHTDGELVALANAAGLEHAAVANDGGGQLLTARTAELSSRR
jgi:SAM-dependent methyltransferase